MSTGTNQSDIKALMKFNFEQTTGTLIDLTDNHIVGTASNCTKVGDPFMGTCMQFDAGNKSEVQCKPPVFNADTSDDYAFQNGVTIATWVMFDELDDDKSNTLLNLANGSNTFIECYTIGNLLYYWSGGKQFGCTQQLYINQWYHLAITVDHKGQLSFFVNGQLSNTTSNTALVPPIMQGSNKTQFIGAYPSQKHYSNVTMAWMAIYNGPLAQPDIMGDMAEGQSKRVSSFRQSLPIDFKLYSDDGGAESPIMFIEDEGAGENLNLRIVNNSTKAITINKNSNPASSTNYHFQLHFRPGVLSSNFLQKFGVNTGSAATATKAKATKLLAQNPNWTAVVNEDASGTDTISFLYEGSSPLTITKGKEHLIVVSAVNASATGGSRNTNVELRYANILLGTATKPITGHRKQNVSIVNHTGDKDIPLRAEIVGNASVMTYAKPAEGTPVANPPQGELLFRIVNTGTKPLPLALPDGDSGPSTFTLSIDVQPEGHLVEWALVDQSVIANVHLYLNKLGLVRSIDNQTLTLEGPLIETLKEGDHLKADGATGQWTVAAPGAQAGDYQIPLTAQPDHEHVGSEVQLVTTGATWKTSRVKPKKKAGDNSQVPEGQAASNETSLPGKELWTIANQSIKELAPGAGLSFLLKGIECSLPAGSSVVTIGYSNIPGHWDGAFELPVQRSPMVFNQNLIGVNTQNPEASLHLLQNDDTTPIRIENHQLKSMPASLTKVDTRISELVLLNSADQTYYDPILRFGSSSYQDIVLNIWTINGDSSTVTPVKLPTNSFSSAGASSGGFAGCGTFNNGYFFFVGKVTNTILIYQYANDGLTYKGEANNYTTTTYSGVQAPSQQPQNWCPVAVSNSVLYAVGYWLSGSIISYNMGSSIYHAGSVTQPHGFTNSFPGIPLSGTVRYFRERLGYLYILTSSGLFVSSIGSIGNVTTTGYASIATVANGARVQLFGSCAYIVSASDLIIVDIANPNNPIAHPPINFNDQINANAFISKKGALLVSTKNGWFLYNISKPDTPTLIRRFSYKEGFEVTSLQVVNNTFCISGGERPEQGKPISSYQTYFYDAEKVFDYLTGENTFISAKRIGINTGVVQEDASLSIPYPTGINNNGIAIGDSSEFLDSYAGIAIGVPENANTWPFIIYKGGYPLVTVTNDGRMGIGINSPKAMLHVDGGILMQVSDFGVLSKTGATTFASKQAPPVAIYTDKYIVAYSFYAFSDLRVKEVLNPSDRIQDLHTLLGLQVSDYQYIDFVGKGTGQKKGLIAQQVKEVFPQAVSAENTDFIPDIYAMATDVGWQPVTRQLRVCLENAHDLKVGDKVRVLADEGFEEKEVVAVPDDESFVVSEWEKQVDKLFVFGKEVHDFHTVDYDQVAMLGVSAIQALHEKVENLEEEVAALKKQNQRLELERAHDLAEIREELQTFKAAVSKTHEN